MKKKQGKIRIVSHTKNPQIYGNECFSVFFTI